MRSWQSGVRRAARAAPFAVAGIVALSVLVRITVRDAVPVVATVFYAAPPAIGGVLLAGAACAWLLQRRRRWGLVAMGAAVLLAAWQARISWFRHEPAPGDLRVLSWNVQSASAGWERLSAEVETFEPDVACLQEALRSPPDLAGLEWRRFPGGLRVGVRGRILEAEFVPFEPAGRAALVRASVRNRPLLILAVDVGSNPLRPRGRAFEPLEALLARAKPDLVLGDFNTPRDSVFFEPWRRELRHAFEASGNGLDLTWPMPVPVLSLDHVWCGPRLIPCACRHQGTGVSDHRAVVAELAWASAE